ncbi:unnamed protein product [Clonostachys rosea]|uniref:Uncharacterized protein n=1 Tax=Bionectria ochroleuca TaxID=29856 RepID=A0ABY6U7M5_BIOOC|nr:unnamed protein product [Clonostachys rosea]
MGESLKPDDEARKVAIVTGAASGIGKALATHLVHRGWRVACCDIQEDAGAALAAELGSNAVFFKLNVTDYDEQAKVFSQVWDKWKRLDALLANAGHSDRGSIYILNHRGKTEIPPKPALLSIKACYESFLYGVQLAIHFMRKNEVPGGQIIATSTIASVHPHQTFPEYCGAKAAVSSLNPTYYCGCPRLSFRLVVRKDQSIRANSSTGSEIGKNLRMRGVGSMLTFLQKDNITLNAVLPGIVATGAVPQASLDATDPGHLTPVRTVVEAYDKCLTDPNLNGQLIECSVDKHIFLPLPELGNGDATRRACTVWEPLFEQKHNEKSGLSSAIV